MDNPMSFNTWTILFLLLAIVMMVFNLLLVVEFKKNKNIWFVSLMVLLFSVTLIDWVMIWTKYQFVFPWFMYFSFIANWAYGPLAYSYFVSVQNKAFPAYYLRLHLIPFVSLLILYLPMITSGLQNRQAIVLSGFAKDSFYAVITPGIVIGSYIHLLIYSVLIYRMSRAFSDWKNSNVWAKWYCYSFLIFALNFIFFGVLKSAGIIHTYWDYSIAFSMFAMVAMMMVISLFQPAFFNGFTVSDLVFASTPGDTILVLENELPGRQNPNHEDSAILTSPEKPTGEKVSHGLQKYKNSGLTPQVSLELAQKLSFLMKSEKMYQDYNLRLDTLAEKLQLTRHHTSQLINEYYKMNFFEYINSLRVEEAKTLLTDRNKSDLTVKEIGYQTGFNNKVSFFKAFKLSTGMTPNEYRQQKLLGNEEIKKL